MKEKLNLLPNEPGCYMMLNQAGDVIYVGKAKNLKNYEEMKAISKKIEDLNNKIIEKTFSSELSSSLLLCL